MMAQSLLLTLCAAVARFNTYSLGLPGLGTYLRKYVPQLRLQNRKQKLTILTKTKTNTENNPKKQKRNNHPPSERAYVRE